MHRAVFFLLAFLQLSPAISHGQDNAMLIEQIAQKRIVREYFDQYGSLQNKQIFYTGKLEQEGDAYQIDVVAELYDEYGQLTEKYTTTYQCNPDDFNILVNVFPFADLDDETIKVDVTSDDFQQLYDLGRGDELEDIHLTMSIKSGWLSFFGSRSQVTIRNRNTEILGESIKIHSEAVIKAYMIGIRIRTINYVVQELLTNDFVLQRQQFTEEDGDWFTMEYGQNKVEY